MSYKPNAGFGALLNVTVGDVGDVIRSYDGADLTQAYSQYGSTDVALIAGKFVTLAGDVLKRVSLLRGPSRCKL